MPIASEPKPVTPEALGVKLPNSSLNPIQVESAYQDMRGILKTASAKKTIASTDEIKTILEDGTTLKMEDVERNDLLKTLNEDQGDTAVASGKIEQCETTYKDTGEKFKTEEEAKKSGGLIAGVNGFEGKFYRKNLQKLSDKDPDFIAEDVSPEYTKGIRGLRRQVAEGDTQAQKTYEILRDGNAVRVTYTSSENGSPQTVTVTLKEFDDLLEKEAANLWTQTHGGEMSFADAKTKFPQIAHAYRIKAERKIASDAKYSFHSTEEPKPDKPDVNKPEAEKNNEADTECAKIYVDLVDEKVKHPKGKDGKEENVIVYKLKNDGSGEYEMKDGRPVIAEFHPELLDGTTDAFLSGTTHLFAAYLDPKTTPEQKQNLMAMIYKHIQKTDPDRLKGFSGAQIMDDRLKNKIGQTFITWLRSIDRNMTIPPQLSDATLGDMVDILSFASACQRGKLIEMSADRSRHVMSHSALEIYNKIFKGRQNPDYENFIIALASNETMDHAGNFLSQQFNIDMNSLSTQAGRTANADSVLNEIATRKGLSADEKNKYGEIFHHMMGDKNLENLAKKLGLPPGAGMGVIMLALFLPMLQGLMDTGNESGGGGQKG